MSAPGSCSPLLSRTLELQAWSARRTASARWSLLNGTLLLVFVTDLWYKCECYTSALHLVEYCVAGALACNLALHMTRLLPPPGARTGAPLPITVQQQKLLGLTDSQLDSSFRVVDNSSFNISGEDMSFGGNIADEVSLLSLSRSWASAGGEESVTAGGGSSPRKRTPRSSPDLSEDRFIADTDSLTEYLRVYELQHSPPGPQSPPAAPLPPWAAHCPPGWTPRAPVSAPRYQLASIDTDSTPCEAGGVGGGGGGSSAPHLWRHLQVDPLQLTQYNLNLRLWLHMTIVSRVAAALHPLEQWAAGGGGGGSGGGGEAVESAPTSTPTASLLHRYLHPPAQRYYVAGRVEQLARRPALSNYRWDRGSSDWDHTKPTDAEIIMHMFATYVDSQAPGGGGSEGAFTSRHVSAGGSRTARSPHTLCIHRVSGSQPPHYLLLVGEETVEVSRGRNNLLHTLLVFIAAADRRRIAPAGLQLGRAGLNLLWVIGR